MRRISLVSILLMMSLTACGVEWMPEYVRLPTTPDAFSFPAKTGVPFNSGGTLTDTSASITVAGLTGDSSPIKVTGPDGITNQYTINGGSPIATDGTVKNGDIVTVQHTTGSLPRASVTSTLSIGNVSAPFTSVTQNVETFALTGTGATGINVHSAAHTLIVATGSYTVSVAGTGGTYSFDNITFSNQPLTFSLIAGQTTIYLTSTVPSTTTVTIDGVASTFTTTAQ